MFRIKSNKTNRIYKSQQTISGLQIRVRTGKLFFLFLNQNICCGYSKEPSQWDGSFEHPKHMFKLIGKEINAILGAQSILIWTSISMWRYWPVSPNCCFHISCLEGDGTGLFPTSRGLKDIGVLNAAFVSDCGVLLDWNRPCTGEHGVPDDLNTRFVGVHGVLLDFSSFSFCFGPVIGVLADRRILSLGVAGVFGVFGV